MPCTLPLDVPTNGDDEEISIAFESAGLKRLLVSFAKLEKIDD